jgi:hypothetical protein
MRKSPNPRTPNFSVKKAKKGWATIAFETLPWDISVKLTEVDGIPQITSLRLEPRTLDGNIPAAEAVVTSDRVRRLPLQQLGRLGAEILRDKAPAESFDAIITAENVQRSQIREHPPEHYEEVARVYLAALEAKVPPTGAVAERWGVGRSMASRYVATARERSLLGDPPRPGVAGVSRKVIPIQKTKAPTKKERAPTKRKKASTKKTGSNSGR